MNKWFEIFKIGTHTDSTGAVHSYTEQDLDTIAANYNPQHDEAPLVIGHPKSNEPAYGWVGEVKRFGNSLFAKAKSIVPEFEQAIKEGFFKKRSIALNPDKTLRHIGFLGAVPPAVKGMQDLNFTENTETHIFEIAEFADVEKEDEVIPSLDDAPDKLLEPEDEILPESVGDVPPIDQFAAPADTLAVVNKPEEDDALRVSLSKLYLKQRVTEFEIFLNEKLQYGTITVPMKNALLKLVEMLSTVNFNETNLSNTFTFADGSSDDPINTVKNLLDQLPGLSLTKTFAEKQPEVPEDTSFSDFTVDPEAQLLHTQILSKMNAENISYKNAASFIFSLNK